MKKTTGKKGRIRSKKPSQDGITFASGLELSMYRELKKNKIPFIYEGETYVVSEGFYFPNMSYEKNNSKEILA